MTTRVYRYDKPEKDVILDILNYTNKTRFESQQLEFSEVQATDDLLGTQLTIKPAANIGWVEQTKFYYNRLDLADTFALCPLIVDVSEVTDANIYAALLDQRNVYFDPERVVLVRAPRPLNVVFSNTNLEVLQSPQDAPPATYPPSDETVYDYYLQATDESFLWRGRTKVLVRAAGFLLGRPVSKRLEIQKWFHETLSEKVAIELAIPRGLDATEHSSHLSRMKVGDVIGLSSLFPGIARSLTGDEWVSVDDFVDFNLFQSKVIYNGFNVDEYFNGFSKISRVLAIELGNACRNLEGVWLIGYNDKEAFRFCGSRLDIDHTLLTDR